MSYLCKTFIIKEETGMFFSLFSHDDRRGMSFAVSSSWRYNSVRAFGIANEQHVFSFSPELSFLWSGLPEGACVDVCLRHFSLSRVGLPLLKVTQHTLHSKQPLATFPVDALRATRAKTRNVFVWTKKWKFPSSSWIANAPFVVS